MTSRATFSGRSSWKHEALSALRHLDQSENKRVRAEQRNVPVGHCFSSEITSKTKQSKYADISSFQSEMNMKHTVPDARSASSMLFLYLGKNNQSVLFCQVECLHFTLYCHLFKSLFLYLHIYTYLRISFKSKVYFIWSCTTYVHSFPEEDW